MFGSRPGLLGHLAAQVCGAQRGAEERPNDVGQLSGLGYRRVRCASEDPAELSGVGAGTDRQAQAPDALPAGLTERPSCVSSAVDTFVTVIVAEPVGPHDEQPTGRARLLRDDRRAVPDSSTQPRIRAW